MCVLIQPVLEHMKALIESFSFRSMTEGVEHSHEVVLGMRPLPCACACASAELKVVAEARGAPVLGKD